MARRKVVYVSNAEKAKQIKQRAENEGRELTYSEQQQIAALAVLATR